MQRLDRTGRRPPPWPPEGVAVGSQFSFPRTTDRRHMAVASDTREGLLVAWAEPGEGHDPRGPRSLRAQRVGPSGSLLWGAQGLEIRSASASPILSALAPDGLGGTYVFWIDERGSGLYAQHVSAGGRPSWEFDGRVISPFAAEPTTRLAAIADGAGGALILWKGLGANTRGIFAARVNRGGGLPWDELTLRNVDPARIDSLRIVPTRGGGAIVAWRERAVAGDVAIRAQRLSHGGKPMWAEGGTTICAAPGSRANIALCEAPEDGAFVAWSDSRESGAIFATRILASGYLAPGWSPDGTPVCAQLRNPAHGNAPLRVFKVELAPAGEGGAMVTWTDDRDSPDPRAETRTGFVMRLTLDGPAAPPR